MLYSAKKQQALYLSNDIGNALENSILDKKNLSEEVSNKIKNILDIKEINNDTIKIKSNKNNLSKDYLSSPIDVIWCYTHECSLNCAHCYILKDKPSQKREDLLKIINSLSEAGVFRISLTGGEPLENLDELEFILENIKLKNMIPFITTNAILINNRSLKMLKKYDVNKVQVSLDLGFNNTVPIFNIYNKMLQGTKALIQNGINVNPVVVLTEKNINYMTLILDNIVELGIKYVKFERLINTGEAENGLISLTEEDVISKISQLKTKYFNKLKIDYSDFYKFKANDSLNNTFNDRLNWDCEGGRTKLYIDIDGNCSPCVYTGGLKYTVGNLIHEAFEDIWCFSSKMNDFRQNNAKDNVICKACGSNNICKGACKANSLKFNRSLSGPDSLCKKARLNIQ